MQLNLKWTDHLTVYELKNLISTSQKGLNS